MLCKFENVVLDKRLSNGELRIVDVLVPTADALGALYSRALRLTNAGRDDVAVKVKRFCEEANAKLEAMGKAYVSLRRFVCKEDSGGRIFEVWAEDLISDVQVAMDDRFFRKGDMEDAQLLNKNCELILKALEK